jgi:hypothetical protein
MGLLLLAVPSLEELSAALKLLGRIPHSQSLRSVPGCPFCGSMFRLLSDLGLVRNPPDAFSLRQLRPTNHLTQRVYTSRVRGLSGLLLGGLSLWA